jgi:hypothetical protein
VLFAGVFAVLAARAGADWRPLGLLALIYTGVPVLLAWTQRGAHAKLPSAMDFAILLLLWLPLEFAAGERWVPRHAQGFLHSVAYGVAILLALTIFTGFRRAPGMKYNLPQRGARDLVRIDQALHRHVPQDHLRQHVLLRDSVADRQIGDLTAHQGCVDVPGADRVHGDAVRREFHPQRPGQAEQAVLGGDVTGLVRGGDLRVDGGNVDDTPKSARLHARRERSG